MKEECVSDPQFCVGMWNCCDYWHKLGHRCRGEKNRGRLEAEFGNAVCVAEVHVWVLLQQLPVNMVISLAIVKRFLH